MFVTGISGSAVSDRVQEVVGEAKKHGHDVMVHDIGHIMYRYAKADDANVQWDWILNADEIVRRMLRTRAFEHVARELKEHPTTLHIVDTHLSFRWYVYPTKGIEPTVLRDFEPYVRCFINIIEDITKIQERLKETSWGERHTRELLIWREQELFLSDLLVEMCGRVSNYGIAAAEPPTEIERIIWHPETRRVYLSFPITNIQQDEQARKEIETFRDEIRGFLVVFDPYALKDYDETYKKLEMRPIQKEVGEATEDRDYRSINQAEGIVVYFPKRVPSKGVDAEMRHAKRTGRTIFLYCPEDLGGGPFSVKPDYYSPTREGLVAMLRQWASQSH